MKKKLSKGFWFYVGIGFLAGAIFALGLAWTGWSALSYFRKGEGLGRAKEYTKMAFSYLRATKFQEKRFKDGDRAAKMEVIKELILSERDRLFPWKKERRVRFITAKERAKDSKYDIVVASGLDRIFQDGFVLQKPSVSRSVGLSAAKGEYESFQVAAIGGENILKSVRLEFSELKNTGSRSLIGRENIGWRVVGSVETQKPYYPVKYVGLWTDPLLPPQPVDVSPGVVQPFWVTIYVPPDTEAGMYRGNVKVFAGNAALTEIPIFLRVYNFALPMESHLKTAFDFYGHITGLRYPQGDNESPEEYQDRISTLNERYILDMLFHRMNPILNIDPTADQDVARLERYRKFGLNNFSIGRYGGTFNNNWPRTDEEIDRLVPLYQTYAEFLQMYGLLDFSYIYAWDESAMGEPIVKKAMSMIHRGSPKLKTMARYHGFWDPDQYPGWGDDIDIWCFQIDNFNEAGMNRLKALGKEIWMYVSGPGGTGSPNFIIDTDSIDYRIIPWLCWRYDIKGFLYWSVNWWPIENPFKTGMNMDRAINGNGLLYYPGPDGPIDSLRIEIFRDGMEDYEYLYLLNDRVKALKEKGSAARYQKQIVEAEKLLKIDKEIVVSMFRYTKDARFFLNYRNRIGELIEELGKGLE